MNNSQEKIVILVAGKIGSGKDTFVKFLLEYLKGRGHHYAFAKPLKDMCYHAFRPLVSWLNDSIHAEEQITVSSWYEKKTPVTRMILQAVGTDIVRQVNPDYWIERAIEYINARPELVILISDWRFPSEYIGLNDHFHVVTVRVRRTLTRQGAIHEHESETALDKFCPQKGWDLEIDNNGTVAQLGAIVMGFGNVLDEWLME
jgi:hypothetical protein